MLVHPNEYEILRQLQDADRAIMIIAPIVIAAFGIPGNLFAALIIRHRRMRDSDLTIYMVSLCLFNILSLAVYAIRNITSGFLGKDIKDYSYYLCGIWILLSHLTISIVSWHHVALVLNRVLHYTLELKDLKRKWEPHYVVTIICLFCGVYNIYITNFGVSHTFTEKFLDPVPTKLEKRYDIFVNCDLGPSLQWGFLLMFMNAVLPALAVAILNLHLCYIKAHPTELVIRRNGITPTSLRRELMRILVIYNVLFIITVLPYYTVNAHSTKYHRDLSVVESRNLLALHLTQALLMVNQSSLLFLACAISGRFRQEFLQFILPMLVKFSPQMEQYRKKSTAADSEASGTIGNEVAEMMQEKYNITEEPQPPPPAENSARQSILTAIRNSISGAPSKAPSAAPSKALSAALSKGTSKAPTIVPSETLSSKL